MVLRNAFENLAVEAKQDTANTLLTDIRTELRRPFRQILDYAARTDGNPVYVGTNTQSALLSAADWTVLRLTYDASNRLTDKQVLVGVWNDRATLGWA